MGRNNSKKSGAKLRAEEATKKQPLWRRPQTLLVVAFLIYLPTLNFSFSNFDDDKHIVENPYYQPVSVQSLGKFWKESYFSLYIPTTYTAWGVIATVAQSENGEISPFPFRMANVTLHFVSCLLVFLLARKLTGDDEAAVFAALLFGVHPIQAQAVSWISGFRDLLFCTLALTALHLGLSAKQTVRNSILATSCYLLALFSKPTGIVVGPVLLVWRYLSGQRALGESWQLPSLWLILAFPIAIITKSLQPDGNLDFIVPWYQRPLIAGDALTFYLGKLLWPVNLAFDYGHTPKAALSAPWLIPSAILGIGIWFLPLLHINRSTAKPLIACCLIFLVALSPNLGLIPFEHQNLSTVADRYLYFPLVALAIASALTWRTLGDKFKTTKLLVASVILLCWMGFTMWHQQDWRDSKAIAQASLAVNPNSFLAHTNLGMVASNEGAAETARKHFARAIAINPNYATAYNNLGVMENNLGNTPGSMDALRKAVAINPVYRSAWNNLAQVAEAAGNWQDSEKARQTLAAIGPQVNNRSASLADFYFRYGEHLRQSGESNGAIEKYQKSLKLNPTLYAARNNLGGLLVQQGQFEDALAEYRLLTRYHSTSGTGYLNLAKVQMGLKRMAAARKTIDKGLKAATEDRRALEELARQVMPSEK